MSTAAARLALLTGLSAGSLACETEAPPTQTWIPYDGAAFVEEQADLPWPTGELALTSDSGADTLTAFDPVTGKFVAKVPVGRDPVGIDGPHHLAIDRPAGVVYVALSYPAPKFAPGPHAAHGSSQRPGYVQKLRLRDLRVMGEHSIDSNPGDIALSADGSTLVISHFDLALAAKPVPIEQRRGLLTWTRAATVGEELPRTAPVCVLPHGVTVAPDGKRVWVACYGEDAVAMVDLAQQPPLIVRVPLGPAASTQGAPSYGPYSIVAGPQFQMAAVGCTESKDLRLFDLQAGKVSPVRWSEPGAGAVYFAAWSADSKTLWVPTQGPDALYRVDATTGKTLEKRAFLASECQKPHEVQRTQSGSLLVVCEGDHVGPGRVIAVDPLSLQTLWFVETGAYPDRVGLAGSP